MTLKSQNDAKSDVENDAKNDGKNDAKNDAKNINSSLETLVLDRQAGGGAGTPPGASNFFVMCTGQVEFGEVSADVRK